MLQRSIDFKKQPNAPEHKKGFTDALLPILSALMSSTAAAPTGASPAKPAAPTVTNAPSTTTPALT